MYDENEVLRYELFSSNNYYECVYRHIRNFIFTSNFIIVFHCRFLFRGLSHEQLAVAQLLPDDQRSIFNAINSVLNGSLALNIRRLY